MKDLVGQRKWVLQKSKRDGEGGTRGKRSSNRSGVLGILQEGKKCVEAR